MKECRGCTVEDAIFLSQKVLQDAKGGPYSSCMESKLVKTDDHVNNSIALLTVSGVKHRRLLRSRYYDRV
jgi:hypothetical protein